MKKIAAISIMIQSMIITGLTFPSHVFADDAQDAAQVYTQTAINQAHQGQYDKAIEELSKALIVDPENSQAQDALLALAQSDDVSSEEKIKLFLVEDLANYNKELEEQLFYYEQKRDDLGEALVENGFDVSRYRDEMLNIKEEVLTQEPKAIPSEESFSNSDPLKSYHRSLNIQRDELATNVKYVKSQFERLREINNEDGYVTDEGFELAQVNTDSSQRFYTDSGERIPAPQSLSIVPSGNEVMYSKDEIDAFKDKIESVYGQLEELQNLVIQQDSQATGLKSDLQNKSLALTEAEKELQLKVEQLEAVSKEVAEIQTKGQEVQALEDQLKAMTAEFEETKNKVDMGQRLIVNKDKEISSLQEQLDIIQGKFDNTNFEEDDRIESMSRDLEDMESRIDLSQRIIGEKDDQIENLRGQLQDMQMDLVEKEREIQASSSGSTDQEVVELKNILEDFKMQLSDAKTVIKTKDERMDLLNMELVELQQKFQTQSNEISRIQDVHASELAEAQSKSANLNPAPGIRDLIQSKETEIANLNKKLIKYRRSMTMAIRKLKEKDAALDNIKDDMAALKSKFRERSNNFRLKDTQIKALKAALRDNKEKRDGRYEKMKDLVRSKIDEVNQLNGIIELYKEKLKDATSNSQGDNVRVQQLEEQLNVVQIQLDEKDEVLSKTKDNLQILKTQLVTIQEKIDELETAQNSVSGERNEEVENEMSELKNKLGDINYFLQKELKDFDIMSGNVNVE